MGMVKSAGPPPTECVPQLFFWKRHKRHRGVGFVSSHFFENFFEIFESLFIDNIAAIGLLRDYLGVKIFSNFPTFGSLLAF